MKKLASVLAISVVIVSCKSKKVQTLPKDVALKPPHEQQIDIDRANLSDLRKKIDSVIGTEVCDDASAWRISPIGSKPCGGPAAYLAYPIKMEDEILPKIQEYTKQQADFNRRNQLMSDCAVTPIPSGIRCENGKPVLIKSAGGEAR